MEKRPRPRSRREALGLLGAFGVVALASCSSDKKTGSGASSTTRASGSATGAPTSCVLAPELTQGPFFLTDHPNASNLVQDREGTPLTLRLTVVGRSCAPVDGARVDVWHCDANGEYAGVGSNGGGPPPPGGGDAGAATRANDQTWCQGYQDAGADGRVTFTTIYPGWYPGRAVHVHVKVFAGGDAVHTGQLFFPDGLSEALFSNPPYGGTPDTTNDADSIYAGAAAAALLVPERRDDGYVADAQLVVDV